MAQADPSGVTLRQVYEISHAVGLFWRIPAAAFILLLAALCTVRNAPARYKRAFDLDGLVREQARTFRTTAAFAKRQLRLVPPARGEPRPADYALTPAEWIDRYAQSPDRRLDQGAARRALIAQLGPPWRGISDANPQARCLFAAFALHLAERRAEALELLEECSAGFADQATDRREGPESYLVLPNAVVAAADAALSDREGPVAVALAITRRHAFAHTALMELLNAARLTAGVLAPAQFAGPKLVDRPMWYALHSLGFETEGFGRYLHPNPRVEALGARAQWAVERAAGRAVPEPNLDLALEALRHIVPGRCRAT